MKLKINIFKFTNKIMNLLILLVVCLVSATAAYLGTLLISRRASFTAEPLGHLAFPGVAIAIVFNFHKFLGVLLFIFLGALLIWVLRVTTRIPLDALTGIAITFGLSLGFILLPIQYAQEAIIGNINSIEIEDLWIAILTFIIVTFLLTFFRKQIVLSTISEEIAKTLGVNVRLIDFIYLISIALVAAAQVKIVGGILTIALVILPSATAFLISRSLKQYLILSPLIGVISSILGLLLFEIFKLPAGLLIIFVSFSIFLISVAIKKLSLL